jgi:hypothetical protein
MRSKLALALALALAPSPAHANNNELTITESTRALRTSSANAITEDSLFGGALAYGRQLGIELLPRLELWAHATFSWAGAEGTMFQTINTELDTLGFTGGARARYPLWRRHLLATARVDLGTARAALELRDNDGHSASDAGWGATTSAAFGLELYPVRASRFALGLRFEIGVVATSSIPLTATPAAGSEDTLELEMTAASLGDLNLSGPVFTASLVSQF